MTPEKDDAKPIAQTSTGNQGPALEDTDVKELLVKSLDQLELAKKELELHPDMLVNIKQNIESDAKTQSTVENEWIEGKLRNWVLIFLLSILVSIFLSLIVYTNLGIINTFSYFTAILPILAMIIIVLLLAYHYLYRNFSSRLSLNMEAAKTQFQSFVKDFKEIYGRATGLVGEAVDFIIRTHPALSAFVSKKDFDSNVKIEINIFQQALITYKMYDQKLLTLFQKPHSPLEKIGTFEPKKVITNLINNIKGEFTFLSLNSEETALILNFVYLERVGSPERIDIFYKILNDTKCRTFLALKMTGLIGNISSDEIIRDNIVQFVEIFLFEQTDFKLENFNQYVFEKIHELEQFIFKLHELLHKFRFDENLIDLPTVFSEEVKTYSHPMNEFKKFILSRIQKRVSESVLPGLPDSTIEYLFKIESGNFVRKDWENLVKNGGNFSEGLLRVLCKGNLIPSELCDKYHKESLELLSSLQEYNLPSLLDSFHTFYKFLTFQLSSCQKLEKLGFPIKNDPRRLAIEYSLSGKKSSSDYLTSYAGIIENILDYNSINIEDALRNETKQFSLFLGVLLINYFAEIQYNIPREERIQINRNIVANENLTKKIFSFEKNVGASISSMSKDIILDSFKSGEFVDEEQIYITFVQYLANSGIIPSYAGILNERLSFSKMIVSEFNTKYEKMDMQSKNILKKLLNLELRKDDIEIMIRGNAISAYILNVSTKGSAFDTLGRANLEKFGAFLKSYSAAIGEPRLSPESFLFTESAGKSSRIGLVPPDMDFQVFTDLFGKAINVFGPNKVSSNLYLSRVDISGANFKKFALGPYDSEDYTELLRELIINNFTPLKKIELLSAIRAENFNEFSIRDLLKHKLRDPRKNMSDFISDESIQKLNKLGFGKEKIKQVGEDILKYYNASSVYDLLANVKTKNLDNLLVNTAHSSQDKEALDIIAKEVSLMATLV